MAELLEITAHGVTAILATWLGLLVVTRASRSPGAPIFSVLCALLVTWSVAIIVQRLGSIELWATWNPVEDSAAFFLPPVTTHLAASIAFEGRRPRVATAVLAVGYGVAAFMVAQAWLDPGHEIGFAVDSFAPFGLPPAAMGWTFAALRLGVWAAGIAFLVGGLRRYGVDDVRRGQLLFAIATVALGITGAMLRILPREIGGDEWLGVSLVALATVMATYAVVAQHLFVSAEIAGRAVRWSLVGGLAVVGYVGVIIGLDELVRSALRIDLPIVTAAAVVVTLALFEPISDRIGQLASGTSREIDHARLVQALGGDPLVSQRPEAAIGPALARLVRTFALTGALIRDADGAVRHAVGDVADDEPGAVELPFTHGGLVRFGQKRSGGTFTPTELEALRLGAAFLGSSLRLAARHEAQATALAELRAERDRVESRGSALTAALSGSAGADGLQVHALGSLRAERNGEPIRRWGGEKAGSRQAEALFAFLFDRGERGAAKDEILELVWPDVDLDRADVAFHRTMLGLRSMLQPGRRRRDATPAVSFRNDRYRLDPSVVTWSDVAEFERLIAAAGTAGGGGDALRMLESARTLYRGDYLDDCPYYGDSADVEERRRALRKRYVDLLVELGDRYAARGDRPAAASAYRDALAQADDELPAVTVALAALGGIPAVDVATPATEPG